MSPQERISTAVNKSLWRNGLFLREEDSTAMVFCRAGLVYALKVAEVGVAIKVSAQVATRSLEPMNVRITLIPFGKRGFEISSTCTCLEGGECKHVAAVLMAAGSPWYEPREDLREIVPPSSLEAPEPEFPEAITAVPDQPPPPLRAFLQSWIQRLDELATDEEDNFYPPAETANRLVYIFRRNSLTSQEVKLELATARINKDGDYVKAAEFNLETRRWPDFLAPGDVEIVEALKKLRVQEGLVPQGPLWGVLLPRILASGRAVWDAVENPPLQMDEEPISVEPTWLGLENGRQRPMLSSPGRAVALCLTSPLLAIDPASHTVHRIRGPRADRYYLGWLRLPELSPQDADHLARHLEHDTWAAQVPRPARLRIVQEKEQHPAPILRLHGDRVFDAFYGFTSVFAYDQVVRLASVEFSYPAALGRRFALNGGPDSLQIRQDDRVVLLVRRREEERDLADTLYGRSGLRRLSELLTYGLKPAHKDSLALAPDAPTKWFNFLTHEVPRLEAKGWTVEVEPTFNLDLLQPDGWYETIEQTENSEWFEIDCGVEVNGVRFQLLPAILAFLRSEGSNVVLAELEKMGTNPVMLPLEGKYLPFPADRLHRILSALTELYSSHPNLLKDGRLEVHRLRAAQLAAAAQERETLMFQQTSETLQQLSRQLCDYTQWKAALPLGLKASLRPYQEEGFRWLRFLAAANLGGILADDMGLGKTLQTLAHLLAEKESGAMDRPSLIVAPKSVLFNWAEEAAKFTPKLRTMIYSGQDRSKLLTAFEKNDLIFTSYPILGRDEDTLAAMDFHCVILDEAQNIKNTQTKTATAAFRLRSRHRLCLTGTPMENHLGELWSIFHFLMPGLLGTREQFNSSFRDPIEKDGHEERRQFLALRIRPVLLRRTKEAVLNDLPPKIETVHRVELTAAQKDLYETVRAAMDRRVQDEIQRKGAERSQIMILDALLKLRQVCCDPRLLKLESAQNVKESAKLDALMEILPDLVEEGRRVLLFSQFTEMLALIEKRLTEVGIPYLILTGKTEDRQSLVRRFQSGEVPIFLISLKAGGVGLNLTAADTVIHYDPWWNPAAENQATDRAHRFGQQRTVFVYKFICQDTIEEKILHLQRRKAELVQGLLEGSGQGLRITQEDLAHLLEPMR